MFWSKVDPSVTLITKYFLVICFSLGFMNNHTLIQACSYPSSCRHPFLRSLSALTHSLSPITLYPSVTRLLPHHLFSPITFYPLIHLILPLLLNDAYHILPPYPSIIHLSTHPTHHAPPFYLSSDSKPPTPLTRRFCRRRRFSVHPTKA